MKTINDIYNQSKETQNNPLLSNYNALFWTVYLENHTRFDSYFNRRFKSFVFFDQEENETTVTVLQNFQNAVHDYLLINDKRFSELFRVQVVPDDDAYSITENYYMEETYSGTSNETGNSTRTLSNTSTSTNDEQSTSANGQRTDVTKFEQGNQKQSNLNSVSAFNSNSLNSKDKLESETGSRNDNTQYTQGAQETTYHGTTNGATSESGTDNTNTTNGVIDGHTLVRHGALGIMTVTDVLKKQVDFWQNSFNFYNIIFDEICKEYLLVGE